MPSRPPSAKASKPQASATIEAAVAVEFIHGADTLSERRGLRTARRTRRLRVAGAPWRNAAKPNATARSSESARPRLGWARLRGFGRAPRGRSARCCEGTEAHREQRRRCRQGNRARRRSGDVLAVDAREIVGADVDAERRQREARRPDEIREGVDRSIGRPPAAAARSRPWRSRRTPAPSSSTSGPPGRYETDVRARRRGHAARSPASSPAGRVESSSTSPTGYAPGVRRDQRGGIDVELLSARTAQAGEIRRSADRTTTPG